MFTFILFFAIPVAIFWQIGFFRVAAILLGSIAATVVFAVGTATGLVFEYMFMSRHVSTYIAPTLYTDAYANNMTSLGQAFAIPYIVVFDFAKLTLHYTLTHGTPILWAFQLWAIYIIVKALK